MNIVVTHNKHVSTSDFCGNKWYIVAYFSDASWDLWDESIGLDGYPCVWGVCRIVREVSVKNMGKIDQY